MLWPLLAPRVQDDLDADGKVQTVAASEAKQVEAAAAAKVDRERPVPWAAFFRSPAVRTDCAGTEYDAPG